MVVPAEGASSSPFRDREANPDRTVHAEGRGVQVVRYDRGGKWYEEGFDSAGTFYRRHIGVGEAARMARSLYLTINYGRSGGKSFDAKARKLGV